MRRNEYCRKNCMEGIGMWKGIDVSDCQGKIDHARVAAARCEFAILRSTRKSGKPDNFFSANLEGFRKYGIPVSTYKYMYGKSEMESAKEAGTVVSLVKQHGLDCIIWWDVEDPSLKALGKDKLTACIRAAREVIETAGYRFGLYSGAYVRSEGWLDFDQFSAAPMWAARYYRGERVIQFGELPDEDKKPDLGRDLWGWQHTSTGRIPGVSGNVDLDICWQDPVGIQEPPAEPGTLYTVSIADVWTQELAQAVAAAYPGCKVHRVSVLDAGGIELWTASVADVWSREQAEVSRRQYAAMGISSNIHQVKMLE